MLENFRRKLGPLPVWGWGVILAGGGFALYLATRRKGAAEFIPAGIPERPEVPPLMPPIIIGGGGGGSGGGGGGGSTDPTSGGGNTVANDRAQTVPRPTAGQWIASMLRMPDPITVANVNKTIDALRTLNPNTVIPPGPGGLVVNGVRIVSSTPMTAGQLLAQQERAERSMTERTAAVLRQSEAGRELLRTTSTAYTTDPVAAERFFREAARNPEGVARMFGGATGSPATVLKDAQKKAAALNLKTTGLKL